MTASFKNLFAALLPDLHMPRQIGMLPDGSRDDRAAKAAFNARTRLLARLRRR